MNHQTENDRENLDRALFDETASKYVEKDCVESSRIARRYQLLFTVEPALAKLDQKPVIVDIACGPGAPADYLNGLYKSYIGIDYSKEMIEAARLLNKGNDAADFVVSNIKDVAELPQPADLVIAVGAFHHMTDLETVFKTLKQIARPGAYLAALEPQRQNPIVQFMRFIRGIVDRSYSTEQHYFSRVELQKLFVDNGMTDIECEFQGYFTPPLAQVILKPQSIFVPLSKLAVILDKILDRLLPGFLKFVSWNIAIRCRFPE